MKKLTPIRMAVAAVAVTLAAGMLPASAAPVCSTIPEAACGFRVFAEPYASATFLQHDNGEYEAGIKALAERFPRFVRVNSLDVLLNDPAAVSYGGRKIWVIEVTDFNVPEEGKLPVLVSTGVHGNERAGVEGSVRYAEDLARWATSEPGHLLRNGTEPDSTSVTVSEALQKVHLYLAAINPDGWSAGDLANGGLFARGNGRGADLNREWPTIGWTNTGNLPLTEPESIAWSRYVESIDPVATADLHGELNSANNAYADIMLPAGQWDPLFQEREERLARHMKSNIDRYFREQTIVLGQAEEVPLQPAEYATGYDVVGYDAAGFMGDYFTQLGALDLDIEHMLSHTVPNSAWIPPHETAHVAAVRGEIETLIVEAIVAPEVNVSLDLGQPGYLFDPRVVTDSDADGYGGPDSPDEFVSYSATPMRYFEDLSKYSAEPLQAVNSADVSGTVLNEVESFVVTTWPLPPDAEGRSVNQDAAVAGIRAFVEDGGNLILTDEGLKLLEVLDLAADGSVTKTLTNAGHVDITNFNDPYAEGLHTTASQTYYEVLLGYTVTNNAPHWSVPTAAWETAGGISVGTVASGRTALGRISLGEGQVGILGALLPPPTEKNAHHYGLADYGVTVTGGQILNNMLVA
ncbi:MAG: M14 family zinc carboxypeptidase [Actinomycetota bacterium]